MRMPMAQGRQQTADRIDAKALAHWDAAQGRFDVEPGPLEVRIGKSSADILLTTRLEVSE